MGRGDLLPLICLRRRCRTRAAIRSARSPCGSITAQPRSRSMSWSAVVSINVDLPVPVFPMGGPI
jgi:hypothetical protein